MALAKLSIALEKSLEKRGSRVDDDSPTLTGRRLSLYVPRLPITSLQPAGESEGAGKRPLDEADYFSMGAATTTTPPTSARGSLRDSEARPASEASAPSTAVPPDPGTPSGRWPPEAAEMPAPEALDSSVSLLPASSSTLSPVPRGHGDEVVRRSLCGASLCPGEPRPGGGILGTALRPASVRLGWCMIVRAPDERSAQPPSFSDCAPPGR
mmetsp:Transcript_145506/g.451326  ORF Transcript_145506/g.451326 Transcript_145506/m.451326 type:complete len:211 (-) Transcript_145506:86-718(-)